MITRLLDAVHRHDRLRLVSVHHEQAAAFAAQGTALITGVPGVALATSGPGAVNLLTGVASCFFDSTPAVFITGGVNRHEQRGTRPIRQLGFQETDIVAMAAPVSKAAWRLNEPEELPGLLAEAFSVARSGRPGPVLIDLPMDVQGASASAEVPHGPLQLAAQQAPSVNRVLDDLDRAARPLIIAGGGIHHAQAITEFRRLAHVLNVPVVSSLLAVDALPYEDPLRVGMIGTYGNRWANLALGRSDCLLVLGSRLDIRQTGADVAAFRADRTIHHVDCDPGEINSRVTGCEAIVSDLRAFMAAATAAAEGRGGAGHPDWLAEIAELRRSWPDTAELGGIDGINPNELMHRLRGPAVAVVTDVGQHQMWAAQSIELEADRRFITSGGMGAMGSGLPLAIGVSLGSGDRPVTLIAGDGGFQLNIQELQTVVRNSLPIKIVLLNNRCHGMVRQFQETYFDQRYVSTLWGYSAPAFVPVARAYGIESRAVEGASDLDEALSWLWSDPQTPALLEIPIDERANVYPKIAFGQPLTEMEPFAEPRALEGT
jgi:acetolactate synthase-1/2/3 large subunit